MVESSFSRENNNGADFQVPEHVIHELGETAGNASSAAELIGNSNEEIPEEYETTDKWKEWINRGVGQAIDKWRKAIDYTGEAHWAFDVAPLPQDLETLAAGSPNFGATVTQLCKAQEALNNSGKPGLQFENSMRFVLIPWKFFESEMNKSGAMSSLLCTLMEINIDAKNSNFINLACQNLHENAVQCQLDGVPTMPQAYLSEKISREGPWGIALMQTSKYPSTPGLDELSLEQTRGIQVEGLRADGLGVFEAISLILQEAEVEITSAEWLPANEFTNLEISSPHHKGKYDRGFIEKILKPTDLKAVRPVIGG